MFIVLSQRGGKPPNLSTIQLLRHCAATPSRGSIIIIVIIIVIIIDIVIISIHIDTNND